MPKYERNASLTWLSRDEFYRCMEYLTDEELWMVSMTSCWFRDAFFALARNHKRHILNLVTAEISHRFSSLSNIKVSSSSDVAKIWRVNFKNQLPRLVRITVITLDLAEFPEIDIVTDLVCHHSYYRKHNKNEEWSALVKSNIFPFPALQTLDMFHSEIRLPVDDMPRQLETLTLRNESAVRGEFTMPNLRELRVSNSFVPTWLGRATKLERLELYHPVALTGLQPMPSLIYLKIEIYTLNWLLKDANRLFPNLRVLSLGRAAFSRVDLQELSPHPFLETLEVAFNRIIGLGHLTAANFPSLIKIRHTGEKLDPSPLPVDSNLQTLVVDRESNIHGIRLLEKRLSNLKIVIEEEKEVVKEKQYDLAW